MHSNELTFDLELEEKALLACCDCGLVHNVKISSVDSKNLRLTLSVNEEVTKTKRENMDHLAIIFPPK